MRFGLSLCVVIVLTAGGIAAQDKPDFSGNWILMNPIESASTTANTMTVRETFTRTSIQGLPIEPPLVTLFVARHFASGESSERYVIGVAGGTIGGVVGNPGGTGSGDYTSKTSFSTTWDGDRLVIETSSWKGDARSDHKEVWSLDARGALLITVTDQEGVGRKTATLVYRWRP